MATIESQMENKSAEELEEIIEANKEKFEFEEEKNYSADEIADMFRYMYAATMTNDHAEGSRMLLGMKPVLDALSLSNGNEEIGLDYLIEWSMMAIRLTPEDRNEFKCLPVYLDLFEKLKTVPDNMKYKQARMRLQMSYHYETWKKGGGDPGKLSDEDYELLNNAGDIFLEEASQFLEESLQRNDADAAIALLRNLNRYYQSKNQPNDALRYLKEIIVQLPLTKEYHPADLGDLYMEMGKVYMGYKKYQTAKKYFELAKEIYDAQGEDWEIISLQAEGHIEDCIFHLKS